MIHSRLLRMVAVFGVVLCWGAGPAMATLATGPTDTDVPKAKKAPFGLSKIRGQAKDARKRLRNIKRKAAARLKSRQGQPERTPEVNLQGQHTSTRQSGVTGAAKPEPNKGRSASRGTSPRGKRTTAASQSPHTPAARLRHRKRYRPLKPVVPNPGEQKLLDALTVVIEENGPYALWTAHLSNRSTSPVWVVRDWRLLWFEVSVPGARKTKVCRLPKSLRPPTAVSNREELAAGETWSFEFDPRFFCYSKGHQKRLIGGALVTAHYGWETKHRKQWRHGRPIKVRSEQRPPYAVVGRHKGDGPSDTADDTQEDAALREVVGTSFTLPEDYQVWSSTRLTRARTEKGLTLELIAGSDTRNGRDATIKLEVSNRSQLSQRIHFRRDQFSFDIYGPDGHRQCAETARITALDRQSISIIKPGAQRSLTTRLAELCDADVFARAGYYLVAATFRSSPAAEELGVALVQGPIHSQGTQVVRVHAGELPFVSRPPRVPEPASSASH